jgi:uncharacterized protein (TIGR03435 family)
MRFRLLAIAFLGVLLSPHLHGQNAPAFEVASIKPSAPGSRRGPIGVAGERLNVTAWTLPELMGLAYGPGTSSLYRFQITGGPDWLDRERFDITAALTRRSSPRIPRWCCKTC